MKKILLFCLYLGVALLARADHITGGEMFYTYTGIRNGLHQYQVTAKFFKDCHINRQLNANTLVSIYEKVTGRSIETITAPLTRTETLQMNPDNPCISNPPLVCYEVGYFEFGVALPASNYGYVLATQVNFRINTISNLTPGYGNIGATYTADIPANTYANNNSARFTASDLVVICADNAFTYSFAAEDKDNDVLRYSFCEAYASSGGGGGANTPPPPAPPYTAVPYGSGFSGSQPLGGNVRIDSRTGVITGIAPTSGTYVVTVCVEELRNGVVIARQRKDLQIKITSCTIAAASILPEYQLCKESFSINLTNASTSPLIKTYDWQLTNSSGQHLASSTNPQFPYTFADTGLYRVKLVINRNDLCSDSALSLVRVYPGFKADFASHGSCITNEIPFTDQSTSRYGQVKSWNWNFGEGSAAITDNNEQNPSYRFGSTGQKNVTLVAGNSVGCTDTVTKAVAILDRPPIELLFKDTLICTPDAVQLLAKGNGQFSWSPAAGMQQPNTAAPTIAPGQTTTYVVHLSEDGCENKDSVTVRVVSSVSLQAMPDTVICAGDAITLRASSNGLQYSWLPAAPLQTPQARITRAVTEATTTYTLTARIGSCTATDDVVVTAIPYPAANAGADTLVCYNAPAQLKGSITGSSFTWSPAGSLNSINVLNPIAKPRSTTAFVLFAYDNQGCPKPGTDTVVVAVLPAINAFAGRDTTVIVGQPLQLQASGGVAYLWAPGEELSATGIANPVAQFNMPHEGKKLKVLVYNEAACVDSAYIMVRVFATAPSVFVPTAFTPNGDGRNDVLRPIAAGMQRIEYFSVYNRWGQLVWQSQQYDQGWNGSVGGRAQASGTYVWVVKAVDYTGRSYFQKGMVTLIR